MNQQEQELVKKLHQGDELAFSQLFELFAERVYNVCCRFLVSRPEAEDAVQEIFCKIYASIRNFRAEARLSSWIYRITVNHCLNIQRQRKRIQLFSLEWFHERESAIDAPKSENPEDAMVKRETEEIIQRAISELSQHQRVALVLYRYEGLSYQEIAEILGCSATAVESRLHQAKQNLGKRLLPIFKEK